MISVKKKPSKNNKYYFVSVVIFLIALLFLVFCTIYKTNSSLKTRNITISQDTNHDINDKEIKEIIVWKNFSKQPSKQQLTLETKPNSVSNQDIDIGIIDEYLLIKLSKIKKKKLCLKFAFKVLSTTEEPHTLLVFLVSKATLNKKNIPVTDVKQDSNWCITKASLSNVDLKELNLYKLNFAARNSSAKSTTFAYLKDIEIVLL